MMPAQLQTPKIQNQAVNPSRRQSRYLHINAERGGWITARVRQWKIAIDNSPYNSPAASTDENARTDHRHYLAKLIACVLSWPAAVAAGWLLGDKQNVFAVKSLWNGPFPITNSPGFAVLALTVIPWALGVIIMRGYPQKKIGYWLCIVAAVVGGMFSFLLWFAFNAV